MAGEQTKKQIIHVGARQLAETVYRNGGLSLITYHQLSARAGTRTHQAFAARLHEEYRRFEVEREYTLKRTWPAECFHLPPGSESYIEGFEISGRADVVLFPLDDENIVSFRDIAGAPKQPFVVEVKTVAVPLDRLPDDGEMIHWQQARLYAYLYWELQADQGAPRPETMACALAYVSAETLECRFFFREEPYEEARRWFLDTCEAYLARAGSVAARLEERNLSIAALRFPYERLREGQAALIRTVYEMIRRRTPLLAQAPTGTGKTMSVLYPAVKELLDPEFEHIFYLTAKTSTRQVAEQALRHMRERSGLKLRSVTLAAKESLCLCKELYCDTGLCPYAVAYYDHLPEALRAIWPLEELTPEILLDLGETYKVCPFELSLDAALNCDVVIGDYNHAFDPRVQLERFFAEGSGHQILLIDEAHNLVDRSREMYSCTLEEKDFLYFGAILPANSLAARLTAAAADYFTRLDTAIKAGEPGWNQLEGENIRVLAQDNFRAIREPLGALAELCQPWVRHMREVVEQINEPKIRRKLVELIGQVKFFLRITDEFWSKAYIACARSSAQGTAIRLICLDVAEKLSQTYLHKHASIFFSATLSPLSYFSVNFCGRNSDNRPETLRLPSPFPPENLKVLIADFISTVYKKRTASAASLAKALALAILLKKGQQFIFFPSFAYMELIMPLLRKILSGQPVTWVIQSRNMPRREREAFLKAFDRPERGETVVGAAVLGGIFGEGIDLVGDKLSGVSIVGVGLPQLSPERNIMREYYDEVYQGGFQYAYLYPGMNKVLQAAGRLIRSEEDKGFLLLLDERYSSPSYRPLLPEEWEIREAHDLKTLKALLEEDKNP